MKIHVISGFLGAGKTTFIKKILPLYGERVALIENEFGDVSIDGDVFESHLAIKEIYAGCICCSLVGSFKDGIREMQERYNPDHLIIEPSGVGSLTDILRVCRTVAQESEGEVVLESVVTLVDVTTYTDYIENFGGFYGNQIRNAELVLLSHHETMDANQRDQLVQAIQTLNPDGYLFETPWRQMSSEGLESLMDLSKYKKESELCEKLPKAHQVLKSFSITTPKKVQTDALENTLKTLPSSIPGMLVRAKGILETADGRFVHFDRTANHWSWDFIEGPRVTKAVFIGSGIDEAQLNTLFNENPFLIKEA